VSVTRTAILMDVCADDAHGAVVVQQLGPNVAATLHKAHYDWIMRLAAKSSRALRLAGARQFGFVGLNGLAKAAKLGRIAGSHGMADAVSKVPSGFHAATKEALKLAGGDAFLAAAKQMDGLEPQPQGKVTVLKDGANADRKRLPTGVALAQADAGRLALKPPNRGAIGVLAMRTHGSSRPKLSLNVGKSGFLIVKTQIGKNRLGHGLAPLAKTESNSIGYVK
jgi:hypothetical protein